MSKWISYARLFQDTKMKKTRSNKDNKHAMISLRVLVKLKASFGGLFKTNFYGCFCKLFVFTKLKFSKIWGKSFS